MSTKREFLSLTTTGRKTGLPREIEIWFVEADGRIYVLAEHGYRGHWVQNILAKHEVRVRVGDHQGNGSGRVLDPEQDGDAYLTIRQLARDKYGWGEGLPVEIRRV